MSTINIKEAIRVLKGNPAFTPFVDCIAAQLEQEREFYENTEANEYLRGRVAVLKQLKAQLEGK